MRHLVKKASLGKTLATWLFLVNGRFFRQNDAFRQSSAFSKWYTKVTQVWQSDMYRLQKFILLSRGLDWFVNISMYTFLSIQPSLIRIFDWPETTDHVIIRIRDNRSNRAIPILINKNKNYVSFLAFKQKYLTFPSKSKSITIQYRPSYKFCTLRTDFDSFRFQIRSIRKI